MNGNNKVWIVLGIIVVGLLLFFLFGRSPVRDTAEVVSKTATSTAQATDRAAVRAEAATELIALRARQQAGESYDSLKDNYAQVRTRLAASYENAEGETREQWSEVNGMFDEFEASARAGTGNTLDLLARLISSLSADVRTEKPTE